MLKYLPKISIKILYQISSTNFCIQINPAHTTTVRRGCLIPNATHLESITLFWIYSPIFHQFCSPYRTLFQPIEIFQLTNYSSNKFLLSTNCTSYTNICECSAYHYSSVVCSITPQHGTILFCIPLSYNLTRTMVFVRQHPTLSQPIY